MYRIRAEMPPRRDLRTAKPFAQLRTHARLEALHTSTALLEQIGRLANHSDGRERFALWRVARADCRREAHIIEQPFCLAVEDEQRLGDGRRAIKSKIKSSTRIQLLLPLTTSSIRLAEEAVGLAPRRREHEAIAGDRPAVGCLQLVRRSQFDRSDGGAALYCPTTRHDVARQLRGH